MKVFVSWSGGKDCALALNRFVNQNPDSEVVALLNMDRATTQNAHRFSGELLKSQVEAMNFRLVRERVEEGNEYVFHFRRAVEQLKSEGVTHGVFGDIYLEVHRNWIEAQCHEMGIEPIFPLWGSDVHDLYREFIEAGFVAKVISVRNDHKFAALLAQNLTMEIYEQMLEHQGFDVCGENGEYHSLVIDGPLFSHKVEYSVVSEYKDEKIHALNMDIPQK